MIKTREELGHKLFQDLRRELRVLKERGEKLTFTQLDLEAEIERIKNNQKQCSMPEIVVQDIIELMDKGYSRFEKDDEGFGSIQKHYNLTAGEVREIFAHPKLAKVKKRRPKIVLIDKEAQPPVNLNEAPSPEDGPNARLGSSDTRYMDTTSSTAFASPQSGEGTTVAQPNPGSGAGNDELFK